MNVRTTFPDTATGHNAGLTPEHRAACSRRTIRSFLQCVAKGEIEFMAPSGTFDKPDADGNRRMHRINDSTARLMLNKNLLVVPVFMEADPFKDGKITPHEVPFSFLKPRKIKTVTGAHTVMRQIAISGRTLTTQPQSVIYYERARQEQIRKGLPRAA
jgi:hypothetical protein